MSVVSFGRVNLIKVALLAIAVTLAACLVAFVGTTRPAGATFPGSNGKILFTKDGVGGAQDIYVMNADGTGQVNLTNSPENDAEPDWSPQLAESRDAAPLAAPPDGVRRSPQSSGPLDEVSMSRASGRRWPTRTAGDRPYGRPARSPRWRWPATRPARAPCPGRSRGTAACPGRRPRGR